MRMHSGKAAAVSPRAERASRAPRAGDCVAGPSNEDAARNGLLRGGTHRQFMTARAQSREIDEPLVVIELPAHRNDASV